MCQGRKCTRIATHKCVECEQNRFPCYWSCSDGECTRTHQTIWHPTSVDFRKGVIPLIEVREGKEDKESTFLWTPLGRGLIQRMCTENKHGVRLVSIKGISRGGKSSRVSWLLRRFGVLHNEGQFEIAPGDEPRTAGVDMYASPITLVDGSLLIILDCEGLLRGRTSVTNILSAMVSYLASCLIINVKGHLTNSTNDMCSRLVPLTQITTPKRQLCLWCTDISDECKESAGDLATYLGEHVAQCTAAAHRSF